MRFEGESSGLPKVEDGAIAPERKRDAERFWAGPDHARRLLREAHVPTVEVHKLAKRVTRHGLRRRRKNVTPLNSVGRGWLLGDINWDFNAGGRECRDRPQQTALLEHNVDAQDHWQHLGCVRVRPDEYGFSVEETQGRVAGSGQGDVEQLGAAVGRLLAKRV